MFGDWVTVLQLSVTLKEILLKLSNQGTGPDHTSWLFDHIRRERERGDSWASEHRKKQRERGDKVERDKKRKICDRVPEMSECVCVCYHGEDGSRGHVFAETSVERHVLQVQVVLLHVVLRGLNTQSTQSNWVHRVTEYIFFVYMFWYFTLFTAQQVLWEITLKLWNIFNLTFSIYKQHINMCCV